MFGIISYADHRSNESAIFGDIPPLYLPCSGRVDHWAKVSGLPSLYSQLITAEFSSNYYLMVRYPNIKIYATEVKYRFLLLTSVYNDTNWDISTVALKGRGVNIYYRAVAVRDFWFRFFQRHHI